MIAETEDELVLLVATTVALFRIPLPHPVSLPVGESPLGGVTESGVVSGEGGWRELSNGSANGGSPTGAAARLDSKGSALFAIGFSNATILLVEVSRSGGDGISGSQSLLSISSGGLLGRITSSFPLFSADAKATEEAESVSDLLFLWTEDGQRLVGLSQNGSLRLWSPKDGKQRAQLNLLPLLLDVPEGAGDERLMVRKARGGDAETEELLCVGAEASGTSKIALVRVWGSGAEVLSSVEGPPGLLYLRDIAACLHRRLLVLLSASRANQPKVHTAHIHDDLHLDGIWSTVCLGREDESWNSEGESEVLCENAEWALRLTRPGLFSTATLRQAQSLMGGGGEGSGMETGEEVELETWLSRAAPSTREESHVYWQDLRRCADQLREEEEAAVGLLEGGGWLGLVRRSPFSLFLPSPLDEMAWPEVSRADAMALEKVLVPLMDSKPYNLEVTDAIVCATADISEGWEWWSREKLGDALESLELPSKLAPNLDGMEDSEIEPLAGLLGGSLGGGLIGGAVQAEIERRYRRSRALLILLHAHFSQGPMEELGQQAWDLCRHYAFLARLANRIVLTTSGEKQLLLPALLTTSSSSHLLRSALATRLESEGVDPSDWMETGEELMALMLQMLNPATLLAQGLVPLFFLSIGDYKSLLELCEQLGSLGLSEEGGEYLRRFYLGLAHLHLSDVQNAIHHFTSASQGLAAKHPPPRPQAPGEGRCQSAAQFWVEVAQLFTAASVPAADTIRLIRLALNTTPPSPCDPYSHKLLRLLFELLVEDGHHKEALVVLGDLEDEGAQEDCLRRLLVALLHQEGRNPNASLIRMDFGRFTSVTIRILEARLRSDNISSSDSYHLLHAFHLHRRALKPAARWMYELGQRLLAEVDGVHGMRRAAAALTKAHQTLLAIPDKERRWILRPIPQRMEEEEHGRSGMSEDNLAPQPSLDILRAEELEEEVVAAEARLALEEATGESGVSRGSGERELLVALLQARQFDSALLLATSRPGRLHFAPVVEAVVEAWAASSQALLSEEEEASLGRNSALLPAETRLGGPDGWWSLLIAYLSRLSSVWAPGPVWAAAANRLLALDQRPLPFTFLAAHKRIDIAGCLAALIEFDELEEAALIAIDYLRALISPELHDRNDFALQAGLESGDKRVWIPMTALDQLLRLLSAHPSLAQMSQQLASAVQEYLCRVQTASSQSFYA